MTTSLSLGPSDDLELHLPSGRRLYIPINEHTGPFLRRVLMDAAAGSRGQKGYIGVYPTQSIVDEWSRFFRNQHAQMRQNEVAEKYGLALDDLDLSL